MVKSYSNILFQYIVIGLLIIFMMGGGATYLILHSLQNKKTMHQEHQKDLLASAKLIVPLLDQTIEKASDLLDISAIYIKTHDSLTNGHREQMQNLLETQLIGKQWLGNFLIKDTQGAIRFQFEKDEEADPKLLRQAGDSGLHIIPPPHQLKPFNPHDLILSLPLYDDPGDFIGEVALSIRYAYLQELLIPNLQEGVIGLGLFSSQGNSLAVAFTDYSHRTNMIGQPAKTLKHFANLPDLNHQSAGEYWIKNLDHPYLIESLSTMPAYLVVIPDKEFTDQLWQKESLLPTLYSVILIIIATLIAITVLFFQARQTLRSFANLKRQVQESLQEIRQKDMIIHEHSKRRAMNDLLIDLAHHWRQPLNTATIAAQNIEDHLPSCPDQESIQRYIDVVVTELTQLSHTISRFSNFYGGEVSKPISIHQGLELVYTFSGHAWKSRGLHVHNKIPVDVELTAQADAWVDLFSAMFMNILEIQKSRHIGAVTVEVQAEQKEHETLLMIIDDAGGIDDQLLPDKLFQPYVTTHYKSRDKGLGLYTIRNIVTYSFHGTISAENISSGAKFTISIPHSTTPS